MRPRPLLGEVLASELAAHRDELIIPPRPATACWACMVPAAAARAWLASLDQSLKRMRIDRVDIFRLHRFDPDTLPPRNEAGAGIRGEAARPCTPACLPFWRRKTREAPALLGRWRACVIHQPPI